MNRLFRSNSSTRMRLSHSSLPEIPQDEGILNSESYELFDTNLDFVQQLVDGMVRLNFDQSRFRSPLEYDTPRSRSPIDLHQPFRQSPILLRDRPASQCSSSRPLAPFPKSRRDLGPELQGVKTRSQVSTPCYIAKQDSIVDQEDDNTSQKLPSPSGTDMEDPF